MFWKANQIFSLARMNYMKKRMVVLLLLCSVAMTGAWAQKHDFANWKRYAEKNAALGEPAKKERRVVLMGNSITEGWVKTHPEFFDQWADELSVPTTLSRGRHQPETAGSGHQLRDERYCREHRSVRRGPDLRKRAVDGRTGALS